MTYKEKLQIEHPGCPVDYGCEDNPNCPGSITCEECWNREIPKEKED